MSVMGLLYAFSIDRFMLEGWCKIRSLQFIASLAVTLTIIPYTFMEYTLIPYMYAGTRKKKKKNVRGLFAT